MADPSTVIRGRTRSVYPPLVFDEERPKSLRIQTIREFRMVGAKVDDGERYEERVSFRFAEWRAELG
jgi:hypothetical protein